MDKLDIADELVDRGVDQESAERLKGEINGNDLMKLIDALKNQDQPYQSQMVAQRILGKYGIKLEKTVMTKENYLRAKFESLRAGEMLDETFGVMTKISEGFTYAVEVSEQTRDLVLDWLDENQVEYQATSPVIYRIECGDRDVAYRTGRALSEIIRKPTVRDSIEVEEKMSKKPEKRIRDAKAKMADIKPRNPVVAAVKTRGGAGAHDSGKDPRKVDKFGRDAKYKPRFDEEIEYQIGEEVMVGEVSAQVKIPHGPNGTIGVLMNGKLEMVSETEVSRLDEGVMGMMKSVNPLFRLRELAGLPKTKVDEFAIEIADAPVIDPKGVLSQGPIGEELTDILEIDGIEMPELEPEIDAAPEMDMAPVDDIAIDTGMDTNMDMEIDAPMGNIPDDAGMPGALGTDPIDAVEPMAGAPTLNQSDAMAQIEDYLNLIQTSLADIRLSEYKSLRQKLQDLTNQVQTMGRDYLGEQRNLKK